MQHGESAERVNALFSLKSVNWKRGAVLSRLLGLLSFVLGTVCAIEGYRLWSGWAGSGVLPAAVSILFIVLAVGFAAFPGAHTEEIKGLDRSELRAILTLIIAFAAYLALVPVLGFLLSTWAFLFAATRLAAGSSTASALVWSGTLSIGSHLVFKVWLGTALPVGPFGF